MLKRFLLFAGDRYYPQGGWNDFIGSYDTLEEARAATWELPVPPVSGRTRTVGLDQMDWHNIVDLETGEVVENIW